MEGAGSPVCNLIYNLNRLKTQESYIIYSIQDFDLLLTALHELDLMVEMDGLKDSIVKQIKFLLINNNTNSEIDITDITDIQMMEGILTDEMFVDDTDTSETNHTEINNIGITETNTGTNGFDGHMLHTVMYGPPGVGKTRVCIILAKIWLALGILKQQPPPPQVFPTVIAPNNNGAGEINKMTEHILISINKIKSDAIETLQNVIYDLKGEIANICVGIQNMKADLWKLKRAIKTNSKDGDTLYDKINRPSGNKLDTINHILSELNELEIKLMAVSKYTPSERIKLVMQIIDLEQSDSLNSLVPPPPNYPLNVPPGFIPINPQNVHSNVPPVTFGSPESFVRIVGREDMVGGFLGQSALKTEKLLRESLGKVLFIDEAYALVNDERDSYGREALTVLNRFMSEHPEELIVIFAGYREMMEQTIFKVQPGLKSRCTWMFEIEGYSEKGLATIFEQQLRDAKWKLDNEIDLIPFFKKHSMDFPAYGRDTNRLVFYCKMCYTETIFDNELTNDKTITRDILKRALKYLQNNRIKDSGEQRLNDNPMYL